METVLLVTTLIALVGAYLNSHGNIIGFYLWLVSNSIFAYHNFNIGEYAQCGLFLAYFLISCNGIYNHDNS